MTFDIVSLLPFIDQARHRRTYPWKPSSPLSIPFCVLLFWHAYDPLILLYEHMTEATPLLTAVVVVSTIIFRWSLGSGRNTILKRPVVELVHGAVVQVRRHSLNSLAFSVHAGIALCFLYDTPSASPPQHPVITRPTFISDIVLCASLYTGRLHALDRVAEQVSSQIGIR